VDHHRIIGGIQCVLTLDMLAGNEWDVKSHVLVSGHVLCIIMGLSFVLSLCGINIHNVLLMRGCSVSFGF